MEIHLHVQGTIPQDDSSGCNDTPLIQAILHATIQWLTAQGVTSTHAHISGSGGREPFVEYEYIVMP